MATTGGEAGLVDQLRRAGAPIPPDAIEPPPLTAVDRWILCAFADLSTERQIGMAIGPVPWSKVIEYAREYKLDRQAREVLLVCIRALDVDYLTAEAAKRPAKDK